MKVSRTLGETVTEQTRDLLDEGLRGEESVVLLGKLLDELLVLVEPASRAVSEGTTEQDCKTRTSSSRQRTCTRGRSAWRDRCRGHRRECRWPCEGGGCGGAWHAGQCHDALRRVCSSLDGTRETLVSLGVVVLETNLQLDGLDEVALLLTGGDGEQLPDGAPHA